MVTMKINMANNSANLQSCGQATILVRPGQFNPPIDVSMKFDQKSG